MMYFGDVFSVIHGILLIIQERFCKFIPFVFFLIFVGPSLSFSSNNIIVVAPLAILYKDLNQIRESGLEIVVCGTQLVLQEEKSLYFKVSLPNQKGKSFFIKKNVVIPADKMLASIKETCLITQYPDFYNLLFLDHSLLAKLYEKLY